MSEDNGTGDGNQGGGEGGTGGEGGAAPAWLGGLPDDLRGDATLSRYADIEALARGHIETKKLASSRVIVPGADADETAWNGFFDAIGRPADAAKYEIPLPEGDDGVFADAFRPQAHKLGLMPQQVKGLAEWWNGQQAGMIEAANRASQAEVDALAKEMGADYAPKLQAAKDLAKAVGITPDVADQLDLKLGSANLLKLFMGLADRAGEHHRVDGERNPLNGQADPDAALTAKMQDAEWRKRLNNGDADVKAEYKRLLDAATRKAATQGNSQAA